MSDPRASDRTICKGERLALIISMGYGYFEAKRALEEHEWDVDDAVASILSNDETGGDKREDTDAVVRDKTTKCNEDSPFPLATLEDDGPQFSPDSVGMNECLHNRLPSDGHEHDNAFGDLVSLSSADHKDMNSLFVAEYGDFGESIGGKTTMPPNGWEEHVGDVRHCVDIRHSLPSAFRDVRATNANATISMCTREDTLSQAPYFTTAELVNVPELVCATLDERSSRVNICVLARTGTRH